MPPALRILLAGALFATGGALIKLCEFPSLQRAGLRAAVAALALFALLPEARRWPQGRTWLLVPAYFGATCLFVVANALTTAANAIFLQSTAPLWIAALSPWLLGERPPRREWLMLAGIAVGMALCVAAPTAAVATAPNPPLGDWLALLSGVSYAALLLGMRWLSRRAPEQACAAVAWGNLCTFPLALLLLPLFGQTPSLGTPRDWAVIAVLGTCQVGLAYALLVHSMAQVPAVRASLLLMIEPALSPLIALAVHGERPHPLALGGGALILGSVALGGVLGRRG